MKVINWLQTALIDFFILNLFLTLVSLPILVAWGLPLSWLSPLGNLIFSPFLSLFLLTSTLAFFCELFGMPHGIFDSVLEYITAAWQAILRLAPSNSYIGCSSTAFYALLLICFITFLLFMLPQLRTAHSRLTALTILFTCTLIILKLSQPAQLNTNLIALTKEIELIRDAQQTVLIDHGAFSERANPASWVQYHLISDLIKATGSLNVDHLIIPRPTIRALEAAAALVQYAQVKTIYYPTIEGEMAGSHRSAFRRFYAIAKSHDATLCRIQAKKTVPLGDSSLILVPGQKIQYREINYHSITILKQSENICITGAKP